MEYFCLEQDGMIKGVLAGSLADVLQVAKQQLRLYGVEVIAVSAEEYWQIDELLYKSYPC